MKKLLFFLVSSLLYADTSLLVLENDAIVGKDNHYTNGVYYTWMSDDNIDYPDILPFINLEKKNVAFSISHAIFTPENKKISTKDLNDLPYAGYLDLNLLSYKSSQNFFNEIGLNIGMVGPFTQADTLQKGFHTLINHDKPKGWDNQLSDELLYGISYHIGYKTNPIDIINLNLDFTTNAKVNIGNFYTGALVGATIRLSDIPLRSFSTIGNFIGANESQLLNYQEKKDFHWALSLSAFYNKFYKFYLIDTARDEGYHISKYNNMLGAKISLDIYYNSFKTSFYLKSINIKTKDTVSSNDECTGGISVLWKW